MKYLSIPNAVLTCYEVILLVSPIQAPQFGDESSLSVRIIVLIDVGCLRVPSDVRVPPSRSLIYSRGYYVFHINYKLNSVA
jgi:hypothetical protein